MVAAAWILHKPDGICQSATIRCSKQAAEEFVRQQFAATWKDIWFAEHHSTSTTGVATTTKGMECLIALANRYGAASKLELVKIRRSTKQVQERSEREVELRMRMCKL